MKSIEKKESNNSIDYNLLQKIAEKISEFFSSLEGSGSITLYNIFTKPLYYDIENNNIYTNIEETSGNLINIHSWLLDKNYYSHKDFNQNYELIIDFFKEKAETFNYLLYIMFYNKTYFENINKRLELLLNCDKNEKIEELVSSSADPFESKFFSNIYSDDLSLAFTDILDISRSSIIASSKVKDLIYGNFYFNEDIAKQIRVNLIKLLLKVGPLNKMLDKSENSPLLFDKKYEYLLENLYLKELLDTEMDKEEEKFFHKTIHSGYTSVIIKIIEHSLLTKEDILEIKEYFLSGLNNKDKNIRIFHKKNKLTPDLFVEKLDNLLK